MDKYTWVDIGSSFLLSEINAAFLWAQLEAADEITRGAAARSGAATTPRSRSSRREGLLRRPVVPTHCAHNAHMYYLLLPDEPQRATALIEQLARAGIAAVFHYVPLHSSPARVGASAAPRRRSP